VWLRELRQRWLGWAYVALLAVGGVITAPLALPLLPVETYIHYAAAIGIKPPRIETHELGKLPQMFADQHGWEEMAATVARVYQSLPPDERGRTAIFGSNY